MCSSCPSRSEAQAVRCASILLHCQSTADPSYPIHQRCSTHLSKLTSSEKGTFKISSLNKECLTNCIRIRLLSVDKFADEHLVKD